jgi:dUTPase
MQEFQYLQMQLRLQREMARVNPEGPTQDPYLMDYEELAEYITWNHTALVIELGEAMNEVGWKPWATSRHINYPEALHEMVDAWHFFMNIMLGMAAMAKVPVSDLAQEFQEYYRIKNAKNLERQKQGYDGVKTKCAYCHRDLNELPADDMPRTLRQGDLQFCDINHKIFYYQGKVSNEQS